MHPITHAAERPDHPAIIMAASGETVTFGELDTRANRWARLFRHRGLGSEDRVAVLMENRREYLEILWGAQRSGIMLVPLSTRLARPEVEYILRDADAKLLLISQHYATRMGDLANVCPVLGLEGDDVDAQLATFDDGPIADPAPGQVMLYSSGTTGRPKGIVPPPPPSDDVQATNPLVALAVHGVGMPTDGSIVYLSPAPHYHAAPLGWCATVHRLGGTIVVMESFDPAEALAAIERYRVTDSQWVPTHFVRMLKLPESERTAHDLSSHRRAIHAAAPCPEVIKRAMIDWWGPILVEYYAGSESVGMTMIGSADWLDHPGSVGRALYGRVHVCGPDDADLPPGENGLVYFENDRIPSYHNDAEKTASALNRHGWMTLGDIGHLDADGFLYLTDRASHMIISGGVNIYPQEVENLLVGHPAVADAAVIGVPDLDLGETVLAVVQPLSMDDAGPALAQELLAFLEPRIARMKLPRRIEFRADLPREANGKLYKRELRDEYAARAAAG
ncbi:acyl-CoA synthetase [Erythrobacter sp. LQ02-29]|uniref:acyl-CoA synthetase n=1 Tax=Erythrobacter sp. LQ02-29 TaxID=2920384 RepID=UPI001F4DB6C1|nr:acyl-CoA synthetase [Erythrobacter sp. LQ02-29]MCP9221964.1 acyl-CoA synthetase [Erythrobacter sp. LQ02-29]